jgi:LAGLIDADG DNA endonuclease family
MVLSDYRKQALIGLLLGDLHASRKTPESDTVLSFDQSSSLHSEYVQWLYSIFEPLVGLPPLITDRKPDPRTGETYNSLRFQTLAFPCLNEFYNLFYLDGVKVGL